MIFTKVKNLVITRGDSLIFNFEVVDLQSALTSAYFSVKRNYSDTNYVVQKSLSNGITLVDTGVYKVRVAPSDTANLDLGSYYYDLQINISGDVYTILKGNLKIEYDVTEEV